MAAVYTAYSEPTMHCIVLVIDVFTRNIVRTVRLCRLVLLANYLSLAMPYRNLNKFVPVGRTRINRVASQQCIAFF